MPPSGQNSCPEQPTVSGAIPVGYVESEEGEGKQTSLCLLCAVFGIMNDCLMANVS